MVESKVRLVTTKHGAQDTLGNCNPDGIIALPEIKRQARSDHCSGSNLLEFLRATSLSYHSPLLNDCAKRNRRTKGKGLDEHHRKIR